MPVFRRALAILLALAFASGCGSNPANSRAEARARADGAPPAGRSAYPRVQRKVRTEIYFGLTRKDAREVKPSEWSAFLEQVVTRLFPAGFTVIDAYGQWRDESGRIVHEPSKLVIVLHDWDSTSAKKLEEIQSEYMKRFGQESVIRSNQAAFVDF